MCDLCLYIAVLCTELCMSKYSWVYIWHVSVSSRYPCIVCSIWVMVYMQRYVCGMFGVSACMHGLQYLSYGGHTEVCVWYVWGECMHAWLDASLFQKHTMTPLSFESKKKKTWEGQPCSPEVQPSLSLGRVAQAWCSGTVTVENRESLPRLPMSHMEPGSRDHMEPGSRDQWMVLARHGLSLSS